MLFLQLGNSAFFLNQTTMKNKLKFLTVSLSCIVIIVLFYFLGGFSIFSSNISIGRVSVNNDDKWNCEFYYLQGILKGKFIVKDNNAKLICLTKLDRGNIDFEIYNSKDSCIHSFSSLIIADTIPGLLKGESYSIKAIAKNAKGSFYFRID